MKSELNGLPKDQGHLIKKKKRKIGKHLVWRRGELRVTSEVFANI